MTEEIFDVCDAEDRVTGTAPRRIVHATGLLHRAVHIWVFNSQGELLLQQRTATKDEFPNCFTSSASGHVDSGETYEHAANRELLEELGLSGELEWLHKLPASRDTANEHTVLYRLISDSPPVPDPGEIAAIEFLPPAVILKRMEQDPELFTPPFRMLMTWWHQSGFTGE